MLSFSLFLITIALVVLKTAAVPLESGSQVRELFNDFMKKYNKVYGSAEEIDRRFANFQASLRRAAEKQAKNSGTAKFGITEFSDMTPAEFKKKRTGLKISLKSGSMPKADIPVVNSLPTSFDWRKKGAVTPVKNQGACGSCWAFSVTGTIEGQWAVKKKKLISLSEQELLDCDKIDEGCGGGLMEKTYKEIIRIGGLETEKAYPYEAQQEDKCHFSKKKVAVYINGSVDLGTDEDKMAAYMVKHGPLSIGINADSMQDYQGGIDHPSKEDCDPQQQDHGVLIVGYGVEKGTPFWIVKNSWGADWGEKGYWRVFRGDGTCGLNLYVSAPTIN